MFQVKQSGTTRAPVSLVFNTDGVTPVIGKTGADATVTYCKADGTTANYAGTGTLTEITANAFSSTGTYQLTIPTAVTDVLGPLIVVVTVTGAKPFKLFFDVVANLAADVYARLGAPAGASHAADDAAIKAVVDTISTSAGSGLGTAVAAIKAKTDNLPSDPADASDVATAITAATGPLATTAALTTVGTNVTGIKAKTDNLPSDPADESLLEAAIAAVGSAVGDTALAASKALQVLVGRRKIDTDTSQETVYDTDDTTPFYRWDLKDETGAATVGPNILEKVPVELVID